MSENIENIQEVAPTPEVIPDQWGSFYVVLATIGFIIFQNVLTEAIMWYNVYRHEEYNDIVERTKNLGIKLKKLKDAQLYGGGGTKERQNLKMIKVQDENYKGYHRAMQGVSKIICVS